MKGAWNHPVGASLAAATFSAAFRNSR
jgi:hypothetical protein